MKRFIAILSAAATALCCTEVENGTVHYTPSQPEGDEMTVSAELPSAMMEGAVKGAGFLKVSDRLCPSWVDGAVLKINGSDFVLDAKPSGSKASFTGKRMDAESYDIFYSASGMSREAVASMDFSKQKQTGNDNPGHLDYYALLSGVNDCEEVFFSPEWATAHGGTLKQSGCLKVKVLLPEGIESLSRISLGCEEKIFHSSNSGDSACSEISIELENVKAGSDGCITVYIATPWFPISFSIPAGSYKVYLRMANVDNDGNTVSKSFKPEAQTLYGNRVNEFVVGGNWPTQYKQGRGSMNDPYIISTAQEIKSIGNLLENDVITCFKLADDIDMSGISGWTPINPNNSARGIYFDGNGKTVSFGNTDGVDVIIDGKIVTIVSQNKKDSGSISKEAVNESHLNDNLVSTNGIYGLRI